MEKKKGDLLYEGKAKKIFSVVNEPQLVWVEYKDSLTAFNAQKKANLAGKGAINAQITQVIFKSLEEAGVKTHFEKSVNATEMICKKVDIIPLEVVTRNRLAGSTAKKFAKEEGTPLKAPLVEFYFKDDALGDPFISDDQALALGFVSKQAELDELKDQALKINSHLKMLFARANLDLIDFKLEFGRTFHGEIILADEISPDTCRLWDMDSGEKLDKDRFRRDLGGVEEAYREVLKRLEIAINKESYK